MFSIQHQKSACKHWKLYSQEGIDVTLWFRQCFGAVLKDQANRAPGVRLQEELRGFFWCKHCERGNADGNRQHVGRCVRTACHFARSLSCGELWIMERMLQPGPKYGQNVITKLSSCAATASKPTCPWVTCPSCTGSVCACRKAPANFEAEGWTAVQQSLEELASSKHDYTSSLNFQSLEEHSNTDSLSEM